MIVRRGERSKFENMLSSIGMILSSKFPWGVYQTWPIELALNNPIVRVLVKHFLKYYFVVAMNHLLSFVFCFMLRYLLMRQEFEPMTMPVDSCLPFLQMLPVAKSYCLFEFRSHSWRISFEFISVKPISFELISFELISFELI